MFEKYKRNQTMNLELEKIRKENEIILVGLIDELITKIEEDEFKENMLELDEIKDFDDEKFKLTDKNNIIELSNTIIKVNNSKPSVR